MVGDLYVVLVVCLLSSAYVETSTRSPVHISSSAETAQETDLPTKPTTTGNTDSCKVKLGSYTGETK